MNFDKEGSKFEKNVCVCLCVCVEGRGGAALTPKLYAKLCQTQKYNYLHNVEHVVKLTFRNLKTLILSSVLNEF